MRLSPFHPRTLLPTPARRNPLYPDLLRPRTPHWAFHGLRRATVCGGCSEIGTICCGRLAEVLLATSAAPQRPPAPPISTLEVDNKGHEVTHVVHVPDNPPGWSAGQTGRVVPGRQRPDRKLTTMQPKPYWQSGWLKQHDRLDAGIVVGDDGQGAACHQRRYARDRDRTNIAEQDARSKGQSGQRRAGRTGRNAPLGWPRSASVERPRTPRRILTWTSKKPIEQHGFTLVDFRRTRWSCGFSNGTRRPSRSRRWTRSSLPPPPNWPGQYDVGFGPRAAGGLGIPLRPCYRPPPTQIGPSSRARDRCFAAESALSKSRRRRDCPLLNPRLRG